MWPAEGPSDRGSAGVRREGLRPVRGAESAPSTPQPALGAGKPAAGPLQKEGTKALKSAQSFPKEVQAKPARPPESPPKTGEAESEAEECAAAVRAAMHAAESADGKVNGASVVAAPPRPPRLVNLEDPAGVERRAAQHALAAAAEDHDAAGIRGALRRARTAGVEEAEIASAERVLSYETQSWLTQEVEGICSTMRRLKQTVDDVEARADAAGGRLPPGKSPEGEDSWLASLERRLQVRVWEGLEQRVEAAVQSAVARATRELLAAAAEVGQLRGQVAPAAGQLPPRPQVPRAVPGQYGSLSQRWRRAARRVMRLRFTASALGTGDVRSFTAASAVGALEASLAEDDEFERIMAQWGQKWPGPEVVRATVSLALRGSVARVRAQDGTARKSAASMTRSSLRQAYATSSRRTLRKTVTFPDDIVAAISEEAGPCSNDIDAATRIQAQYRGHREREEMTRGRAEAEAATKIQTRYRGHRDRESVLLAALQNGPPQDSAACAGAHMDEAEAATQIQARYRGHRERQNAAKVAHEDHLGATRQAAQKALFGLLLAQPWGLPARMEARAAMGDAEAATVIQAQFRGHRERRVAAASGEGGDALGEARSAVDDIEACGRRMEAARLALQQKVDSAASLVQARYRGLCGRREAAQRSRGVQKLQQAFRRMQINRKAGQSADFYRVALLLRKRNQAFVDAFLEFARKGGRDAEQGLCREGFLAAATDVLAKSLCGAQAEALWRGFEEPKKSKLHKHGMAQDLAQAAGRQPPAASRQDAILLFLSRLRLFIGLASG
ncbi:unnamed protein product [Prorocentrum cordatum]|uniref:Uncharacterized protein n=1 Tax=Prorocentrum cordatum TaxID=2364126 RepID=A0ABN9UXA3_9DINO|nr:unnamed protein product [Polarella glacialis]